MEERLKAYLRKYKELTDTETDSGREKKDDKQTVENISPAE